VPALRCSRLLAARRWLAALLALSQALAPRSLSPQPARRRSRRAAQPRPSRSSAKPAAQRESEPATVKRRRPVNESASAAQSRLWIASQVRETGRDGWTMRLVRYMELTGWYAVHVVTSIRRESSDGKPIFMTALAGKYRKGFPDIIAVRDRLVAVETKSQRGVLSPEQVAWRTRWLAAGGEHYVLRPADWRGAVQLFAQQDELRAHT